MEWWLLSFFKIVIINLILSGDNALVIAMASRNLPKHLRNKAVFWGSFAAVALRIGLTIIALQLLKIPFLTAFGSILLLWIAVKLINSSEDHEKIKGGQTIHNVVMTIIVADFVMSIDNVIAIAAVADGNLSLIILGILISIPFVVFGSQLVLSLIERIPIIIYLGSGILGFTAGEMLLKDQYMQQFFEPLLPTFTWILPFALAILVIVWGWTLKKRSLHAHF
ncbi:TerC family protein [Bacillus horti]|uniref:YjbE family integral membrane protein n=1 Tax=Caldalkalibacillus horti TaxID=77523 RepID=A0ABT9W5G8_9BACI|nr:TerC family protein [Bacillus horti]MDQ0168476.1 YjbE family integral membrane protein [Bacillus horti]